MTFLIVIHLIVSILLIVAVLLQSGKGSSMANVFGGGMETVFGAETPAIMNRITTALAILFMVNCILLTTFSFKYTGSSVIQRELQKQSTPSKPEQPLSQPSVPQTPSTNVPPAQNK
jgi:preprotein translocase subunit SecG